MSHTFTVTIQIGNNAMQTNHDIAEALEEVATKLRNGYSSGYIWDANGNTVGDFINET